MDARTITVDEETLYRLALGDDIFQRFQSVAHFQERNLPDVVREALEDYLTKAESGKPYSYGLKGLVGIISSGISDTAEHMDEILAARMRPTFDCDMPMDVEQEAPELQAVP